MKSDLLSSLLRKAPDERARDIRLLSAPQQALLFSEMAADPDVRITDIITLGPPWSDMLITYLVGDPQRGIPSLHRSVYVAPDPAWTPPPPPHVEAGDRLAARDLEAYTARVKGPPMIENGTYHNQRRWVPIARPMQMPADRAYLALLQYGPTAPDPMNKGRLIEINEDAYHKMISEKPAPARDLKK